LKQVFVDYSACIWLLLSQMRPRFSSSLYFVYVKSHSNSFIVVATFVCQQCIKRCLVRPGLFCETNEIRNKSVYWVVVVLLACAVV